jgi:hypothetical protein
MKIRGHLVDMPLDFLIVRPPLSWRLFTDEIGGERFDGSGKSSLECDYAELTFSELARCEPVYLGSLCLSKSFVPGRPQLSKLLAPRIRSLVERIIYMTLAISPIIQYAVSSNLAIYHQDPSPIPAITPNPGVHATSPLVSLKQSARSYYY